MNDAALADYDKVIELDPNDAGAYNKRGIMKCQLGRYEELSLTLMRQFV